MSSAPSGINCGTDCSEPYSSGTTVALTATADAGSTFAGWSGGCNGGDGCTLTLTASTMVTAGFAPALQGFTLTVTKAGKGSGSVDSTPWGISCGTDCAEAYPSGATVTLTATPAAGSVFAGWTGACSGKGTCTVTLAGDAEATASFRRQGNARK